jgi:hypothetical protein
MEGPEKQSWRIRICKDQNVLGEYLSGREKEVKALSTRLGYI